MEYIVCSFRFTQEGESYSDILASLLCDIGYDSFEYTDGILKAYIQSSLYDKSQLDNIISEYPIPGTGISYTISVIEWENWNSEWESSFSPVQIDDIAYIHSTSHPRSDRVKYDIKINPCMTFGSGSHSTTRLVLRMVFSSDLYGKSVLDLGCGTGILGIGAKLKGCGSLYCMDIDPTCIENTKENLALNGISDFKATVGSIDSLDSNITFDIILANIHRNIHLSMMEQYTHHLNPSGELYLSGFYTDDVPIISDCACNNGFVLSATSEEEGWCALKFLKV